MEVLGRVVRLNLSGPRSLATFCGNNSARRECISPFPKRVRGTFPILSWRFPSARTNFFIKKAPRQNILRSRCIRSWVNRNYGDNFQTPNVFSTRANVIFSGEQNTPLPVLAKAKFYINSLRLDRMELPK